MTIPHVYHAYGLKPEVWGRVVPDPRAELQVDPARGPQVLILLYPCFFFSLKKPYIITWPVIVHAGDFFDRTKKSTVQTGDFFDWIAGQKSHPSKQGKLGKFIFPSIF